MLLKALKLESKIDNGKVGTKQNRERFCSAIVIESDFKRLKIAPPIYPGKG